MSEFDVRWQACVGCGRQSPRPNEAAPFGFASRVLAVAWDSPASRVSLETFWQRVTFASLGILTLLLLVCAVVEMPHLGDRQPLEPGIENTVAQVVWSL